VPLKVEKDGRVFPVSDNGKDIVKIFEKMFQIKDIDLHLKEGVDRIEKLD
jgi:predicted flavoprotein YhiN